MDLAPHDAIDSLKYHINGYNYAIEGDKIRCSNPMDQGTKQHSLTGVTQGSILSPLLFNIYLNEFDKYIRQDIQHLINIKQNINKIGKQSNQLGKIRYKFIKLRAKIKETQPKSVQYEQLKKEEKALNLERLQTPTIIPKTKMVKIKYCRYAEDWILFIDGPKPLTTNPIASIKK